MKYTYTICAGRVWIVKGYFLLENILLCNGSLKVIGKKIYIFFFFLRHSNMRTDKDNHFVYDICWKQLGVNRLYKRDSTLEEH